MDRKTVKDIVSLLSCGQHYELVGARTGKRIACTWNNKKEYMERFSDYSVTDTPIYTSLYTSKRSDYTYPIISIWVSGE